MPKYADIIVNRHHQQVDRIFTYGIPEEWQPILRPGMLVEVPFTRGNQTLMGYVIKLADEISFDAAKLKSIIRVIGTEPYFSAEQLALAEWMSERYGATLSSCLAQFMPKNPEVTRRTVHRVTLADGEGAPAKRLGVRQAEIIDALKNEPGQTAIWEELSGKYTLERASLLTLVKNKQIVMQEEPEGIPPASFVSESAEGTELPSLTAEQRRADDAIRDAQQQGEYQGFLLYGITGSGKTEVYMRAISRVLNEGRQAILLVPEISLTPQLIRVLSARFGKGVGVIHSGLSNNERSRIWELAKRGCYRVMIGPRSALFTPFGNLGIVILDEEHESSYRSDEMPAYHAREVAEELCRRKCIPLVLGSATPSVESYYRAEKGELTLLTIKQRATGAALPKVRVVDMRKEAAEGRMGLFSDELTAAMRQRLERGEQTILFLNRRGYASFVNCRSCGFVLRCPNCYLPYTYHKDKDKLICHHCGKVVIPPKECPECGSPHVHAFGVGTERVVEETERLLPGVRAARMDLNTVSAKNQADELYEAMAAGQYDVLVGTQMAVKGFDFPKVTLVGIISADMMLYGPDYHNVERSFQLITQAAGRAGRAELPGEVILQAFSPEHYAIECASEQNYERFYREESMARQLMACPPYEHIMQIGISGRDEDAVRYDAAAIAELFRCYGRNRDFVLLGPSPASLGRINNVFRWKLLIKHKDRARLMAYARYCIDAYLKKEPKSVISMSLDPDQIM